MQTTTARALGACTLRDIGCALRNPTSIACMAVALVFSAFYGQFWSADIQQGTAFSAFIVAFVSAIPVLEAGGVITLFATSEEVAHNSYGAILRTGSSLRAIVAGKLIAGWLFGCVLGVLCFWVAGVGGPRLAPIAAVFAVGSLPFLAFSSGFGLVSKDQMHTNFWAWPLALSALLALLGTLGPEVSFLMYLSPMGLQVAECVAVAGPGLEQLHLLQPALIASWCAWMAASVFCLRRCMAKWRQQNPGA
ncbi:hypothetical protein [Parvibacter caecicola]|uniref:hypothetical protein n=1 Tax=Parvibacter caecicola TaxID=747645 RepID=UPI0023F51863|nr:hypothetical protein [Parvibacter caecicola]